VAWLAADGASHHYRASQAFAAILPLRVLRIPNLQPGGARADRVRAVFPLRDDTLEVVFASYGEELNAAAFDTRFSTGLPGGTC